MSEEHLSKAGKTVYSPVTEFRLEAFDPEQITLGQPEDFILKALTEGVRKFKALTRVLNLPERVVDLCLRRMCDSGHIYYNRQSVGLTEEAAERLAIKKKIDEYNESAISIFCDMFTGAIYDPEVKSKLEGLDNHSQDRRLPRVWNLENELEELRLRAVSDWARTLFARNCDSLHENVRERTRIRPRKTSGDYWLSTTTSPQEIGRNIPVLAEEDGSRQTDIRRLPRRTQNFALGPKSFPSGKAVFRILWRQKSSDSELHLQIRKKQGDEFRNEKMQKTQDFGGGLFVWESRLQDLNFGEYVYRFWEDGPISDPLAVMEADDSDESALSIFRHQYQ
jgi:hypothetical protein